MQVSISWWNTGLTPPSQKLVTKKPSAEKSIKVKKTVQQMCSERPLDIIILCEVYNNCEDLIKEISKEQEMSHEMLTAKVGGVYYDFAILYESTKIKYISHEPIDKKNDFELQIRLGVKLTLEISGDLIYFFISHWNSDMFTGGIKRESCAKLLRTEINLAFHNNQNLIVLIGDYNCQPFDEEMINLLASSKDYDIVKKRRRILYNPFWKHLDKRHEGHSFSGTYINKSDQMDKWKTFDQMLFSSYFLSETAWSLDNYYTEFHRDFNGIGFEFTDTFDHVPIYGRIVKID